MDSPGIKIFLQCTALTKTYKGIGLALFFVGILFILPNAGMLFKTIGCIPIIFAIYLLTLNTTLEIGPCDLIKTTIRFNIFKSIDSESIDQYKCLELSTKSNYSEQISTPSRQYYSFTFLPIDGHGFLKKDISMYIESFNKNNMEECLALAESISKITKLPVVYSESFALEIERSRETPENVNKFYYNLFMFSLIPLFLAYIFRDKWL